MPRLFSSTWSARVRHLEARAGKMHQSRRDAYVAKMKAQLDELIASVDALEARVAAADGRAKVKAAQGFAELRARALATAAKLDEVMAADVDAWDRVMTEMDHAWEDFRHAANFFQSQL